MEEQSKKQKLSSFQDKFRKGFGGKKKLKKLKTETTGQKLMKLFKDK